MNAQNLERSKGSLISSSGCYCYYYSESGTAEALSQTWAPMEVGPATEVFVAVTKSNLEDLALHQGCGWVA